MLQTTLEELLEEVRKDDRVCPKPRRWNELYHLMLDARKGTGGEKPSPPLILAGWWASSNLDKILRLQEHIHWASSNGCFASVCEFLKDLPESEWHHFYGKGL